MAPDDRLEQQLAFVREIDKLKTVLRQNDLADGSRRENSAEHTWHLMVMAMLLAEHADERVDLLRVLSILLVHDIVEIDAGDTFVYDEAARAAKADAEREAAERIFGLLPDDQARAVRELWDEFEERATPEARYAAALDRLQPLLLNRASGGAAWRRHGVTSDRVIEVNSRIGASSAALWACARRLIDGAVDDGMLEAGSPRRGAAEGAR